MVLIIPSRAVPYLLFVAAIGCGSSTDHPPDPVLTLAKTLTENGDNQSWSTGHNMLKPLRVVVTSFGVPVEGVEVTWEVTEGNGYIAPLIAVTGADGVSTARWGMSAVAGVHHATAAVADAEGSPVTFTATAYPNFAHQVSIYSGNGQEGSVGTALSEPLTLRVGDQFDNPFPGAPIEWIVTSGDAVVAPVVSASDASGLARTLVTLGVTPGPIVILARFPGAASGPRASFSATAIGP